MARASNTQLASGDRRWRGPSTENVCRAVPLRRELLEISPLILALIIAPLATELPEKANSFLWVRDGKDALALGNITGARVFQATIPVAVGVAFTSWQLDRFALFAGAIAIAGGLVAYWSLERRRHFAGTAIVAWSALFATFVASAWLHS